MQPFKLEILSPAKRLFKGEANMLILPGDRGRLGVLKGHAPLVCALKKGKIRVKTGAGEKAFDIERGFAEVNEKGATVLVR